MRALAIPLELAIPLLAGVARAATFTVANVDATGPGSLHQAVLDANASSRMGGTLPAWSPLPGGLCHNG